MKKVVLLLSLASAFSLTNCHNGAAIPSLDGQATSDAPADGQTPEALRMQLVVTEQSDPAKYITAEGATMTHNLVREAGLLRDAEYDGWIVAGTISNSATLAKFKDVVLTISMISQTGSVIESNDYTVYEFFDPNSSKPFSIKINPSEATDKFNVTVKSAVAVD